MTDAGPTVTGKVDRIYLERSHAGMRTDVYIIGSSNEQYPQPMYLPPQELVRLTNDENPQPTFSVSHRTESQHHTLQEVMDTLYSMGIRPTPGKFAGVADDAQASHLADMRRLVFDSNFINWKRMT